MFSFLKLALLAAGLSQADAFFAPASVASATRTAGVSMDTSWRRSYNGKAGGAAVAAPAAAAAAPSGSMSIAQACKFMEIADGSVESKAAFLASKGVDAFTIAQAGCTSLGQYDCFGPVKG